MVTRGANVSPEYWSCLRKLRYARKAAQSVADKNPERGLRIYRCDYAHHWHITHAPLEGRNANRGRSCLTDGNVLSGEMEK